METQENLFQKFNNWLRESVMVKLGVITFLVLILLIPSSWIQSIMTERQYRVEEVMNEVSQKWSGPQRISGPILMIPYYRTITTKTGTTELKERVYILPEQLKVKAELKPEVLNRGIFDAVVYHSNISTQAKFVKPDFKDLNIDESKIIQDQVCLLNGVSDLRGIGENPALTLNGKTYATEPYAFDNETRILPLASYVKAKVLLSDILDTNSEIKLNLKLKGSRNLFFIPIGKSSEFTVNGDWGNPSFAGSFLPETRTVDEAHFDATWKILGFNRDFPQQWKDHMPSGLEQNDLGVNLLMPVDQYQKSIRTAKYGILVILLTFISLFMIELIVKTKIHPFQYILIGAALIIYYTLLLSISEHLGFNPAYIISSLLVIGMITLYSISFLRSTKVSALLAFLLSSFYTYIFIITQQEEYALLLGSIGLFIIIGIMMYVSRKINWYGEERKQLNEPVIVE